MILADVTSIDTLPKKITEPSGFVADFASCLTSIHMNLKEVDEYYLKRLFKPCLEDLSQIIFEFLFKEGEISQFNAAFIEQLEVDFSSLYEFIGFDEHLVEFTTVGLRELRQLFRLFLKKDFSYFKEGSFKGDGYDLVCFINKFKGSKSGNYATSSEIKSLIKELKVLYKLK